MRKLPFIRLLSAALVAALVSGTTVVAVENRDMLPLYQPSVTGSYLAGRRALEDMRLDEAVDYFSDAVTGEWENPVVIEQAFIANAADGRIPEAARLGEHLAELTGPNDLASLVIATEALKQRRYAAAARELGNMGGDTYAGIAGNVLRAWALTADGKIDEANRVLDEVGEGGLEDFLVFHRALMADVSGRSADAIQFAARAFEADPYVARIVEAYLRILGNAGRFDEAAKALEQFDSQGLSHPLVDTLREPLAQRRRPGVFAAGPQAGAAEMFHSIGVAIAREGSPDIAALFLRLGMYLDPGADVIDLVFGQLLDDAGQHTAANDIYEQIADASPLKPMAVVRMAGNLDGLGDLPGALRELEEIVAENPDDLEALSVLGDLQRSDKQYAAAAATYTRALEVSGGERRGDWRFFYVRGISHERDKQWPKAEADFKRALELNPGQPQVLNYLGYSWVDQGSNLVEALELIEEAVAAAPNDGYIVDSLGWAYYRLGRFDEAVTVLEQAVQMRSADPEINDHLGDAYWRVGRLNEARFQWNIAVAVDTEGDVTERARKKLAEGLADETVPPAIPVAEVPPSQTDAAAN